MRSLFLRSAALFCAAGTLLGVTGCGTNATIVNPGGSSSGSLPTATLASPGGASTVYAAVDNSTPVVVQYAATASGTPTPLSSINIPQTPDVEAIAVDKNSGTIYVTGYSYTDGQPEIYAYASGSTVSSSPVRTILMGTALSTTTEPYDITVDSAGNVYVAAQDYNSGLGSVVEYSSTANGAATPLRVISGASTGIATPVAVAVDSAGTLYVSSRTGSAVYQGAILEFASSASGNVAPLRSITGTNVYFDGLAVDASLNLYASQVTDGSQVTNYNAKIVEFAPAASGAATPAKTITCPDMYYLGGVKVDSVGNVYAVNYYSQTVTEILGFGPSASGYVNPGVTLTPTALNGYTTTSLALQ
jgi:hypothetical protein